MSLALGEFRAELVRLSNHLKSESNRPLVSLAEAAGEMKISPSGLEAKIWLGEITPVLVGGLRFVARADMAG